MDEDNLSKALMIGVTTFIGVLTVSAIIIFFNSSLNVVRSAGSGKNFNDIYRNDIESTLLMSGSGNYIKGTSVINLLNFYEDNINVSINLHNVKYLDQNGNIQIYSNIDISSNDINIRKSAYNTALRYIMDNQDFTIEVQEIDAAIGSKIIAIRGV